MISHKQVPGFFLMRLTPTNDAGTLPKKAEGWRVSVPVCHCALLKNYKVFIWEFWPLPSATSHFCSCTWTDEWFQTDFLSVCWFARVNWNTHTKKIYQRSILKKEKLSAPHRWPYLQSRVNRLLSVCSALYNLRDIHSHTAGTCPGWDEDSVSGISTFLSSEFRL